MSPTSKREHRAQIYDRYQRAGRPHKSLILGEFCQTCGYHRKSALRRLGRPLPAAGAARPRPGPKPKYDPAGLRPVLKVIWLASEQLCRKLLQAALPAWLGFYEAHHDPLPAEVKQQLLASSPAPIDRWLRPLRVWSPKKGLSATETGTLRRR